MNATTLSMGDLLVRAGFRLRGKSRADCIHCSGSSVGTVSFTAEVAHCFRCGWKSNTVTLARELGLAGTTGANRQEQRELAEYLRTIERFEKWRDAHVRRLSTELRVLGRTAARATEVLKIYPDCEPAWDAFARFAHREAELNYALDMLTFAKAGVWSEEDCTVLDLFEFWRSHVEGQ